MSVIHTIRLPGPWEYCWGSADSSHVVPREGRLRTPTQWPAEWAELSGELTFSRWFHRPTNIQPDESVWLVVANPHPAWHLATLRSSAATSPPSVIQAIELALDEGTDSRAALWSWDMTQHLQKRMQLSLFGQFGRVGGLVAPFTEVRLEIRST